MIRWLSIPATNWVSRYHGKAKNFAQEKTFFIKISSVLFQQQWNPMGFTCSLQPQLYAGAILYDSWYFSRFWDPDRFLSGDLSLLYWVITAITAKVILFRIVELTLKTNISPVKTAVSHGKNWSWVLRALVFTTFVGSSVVRFCTLRLSIKDSLTITFNLISFKAFSEKSIVCSPPLASLGFRMPGGLPSSGFVFWDLAAAMPSSVVSCGAGMSTVTTLAFSPDGHMLAAGTSFRREFVWSGGGTNVIVITLPGNKN